MSRVLHYDCPAGISGDMNLAALISLGVPADYLKRELARLDIGEFDLHVCEKMKEGIRGIQVEVREHSPSHAHDCGAHGHRHGHSHEAHGEESGHHHHRSFGDIRGLIEASSLSESVKTRALKIFTLLAEAEAEIHGRSVEEVHFHEVGAVDSIVDIVGAALCLDWLAPDRITCGVVELGSGTVHCAHGVLPVPAPATALLARRFPTSLGGVEYEATTPTGAACLAATVDEFQPRLSGRCVSVGTGLGHRSSARMVNMTRVMLYETGEAADRTACLEMAVNLDDMTPEHVSYLTEKLFAAGAMDVWQEMIQMKKGRLGVKVCALSSVEAAEAVRAAFFRHSTTLGLREKTVGKYELGREVAELSVSLGTVRVKTAVLPDGSLREKPEFDDCRRLAEEHGLSLGEVVEHIRHERENG